jgi:hypothetical protein
LAETLMAFSRSSSSWFHFRQRNVAPKWWLGGSYHEKKLDIRISYLFLSDDLMISEKNQGFVMCLSCHRWFWSFTEAAAMFICDTERLPFLQSFVGDGHSTWDNELTRFIIGYNL